MRVVALLLAAATSCSGLDDGVRVAAPRDIPALLAAATVWLPSSPAPPINTYAAFRAVVTLPLAFTLPVHAYIFADSRYTLFVGGLETSRGPARFHPSAPEYDVVDVSAALPQPGTGGNVTLAVLALSYASCQPFMWQSATTGGGSGAGDPTPMTEACWTTWPGAPTPSGRIMNHVPGLTLALVDAEGVVLATTAPGGGTPWMSTAATAYAPPPPLWGSLPDVIDARVDDLAWLRPGFAYTPAWAPAEATPFTWGPFTARSIPRLTDTPLQLALVAPGWENVGESPTPGHSRGAHAPRVRGNTVVARSAAGVPPPLPRYSAGLPLAAPTEPLFPVAQPLAAAFPLTLRSGQPAVTFVLPPPGAQGRLMAHVSTLTPGANLTVMYYQRLLNGTTPAVSWGAGTTFTAAGTGEPEPVLSADTWGHLYLTMAAHGGDITVINASIVSSLYPYAPLATFSTPPDAPAPAAFLSAYLSASVATAAIVSEDAFEDCAGRERAEWVGDAVFSTTYLARALLVTCEPLAPAGGAPPATAAGFSESFPLTPGAAAYMRTSIPSLEAAAFCPPSAPVATHGDLRLHTALLRRAAATTLARYPTFNVLKAHTTSERNDFNGYMEDYACGWVSSVRVALEAGGGGDDGSGRGALLPAVWPTVRLTINKFLGGRTESGLLLGREFLGAGNPLGFAVTQGATLNAVFYRALLDGAWLAAAAGRGADADAWASAADSLRAAMMATLFDSSVGTFLSGIDADGTVHPPTPVAAFVAISSGVLDADPPALASTLRWLLAGNVSDALTCPYQAAWLMRALFDHGAAAVAGGLDVPGGVPGLDAAALGVIADRFPSVLAPDTATTTEMFGSGDYQHQMGATAALFIPARVLGVRAQPPATALVLLAEPHLGGLPAAAGRAGTELGPAEVAWAVVGGAPGAPRPWVAGSARSVTAELNFTLATVPIALPGVPPAPALTVTMALPLADPWTPPPSGAPGLAAVMISINNGAPVSVAAVLAGGGGLPNGAGTLVLDAGGWYLRLTLPPLPPMVGTAVTVHAELACSPASA